MRFGQVETMVSSGGQQENRENMAEGKSGYDLMRATPQELIEEVHERGRRIAALVALCEEVITDLSLYNERIDTGPLRDRLDKLRGG